MSKDEFLIVIYLLNDSSIKLWALTGQVLMEMTGHSSLVYSVDAHSSGLVASGSEDCFLKIWKGDFLMDLYIKSFRHYKVI